MSGNFIWTSVGVSEVWSLRPNFTIAYCKKPCTGNWNTIDGLLKQVSVGEYEVWGVNMNDDIYMSTVPFTYWRSVWGKLKNVSVGKYYVYGVNAAEVVYRCRSPCTGSWERLPGSLAQISASLEDESVFGVTSANELNKWVDGGWEKIGTMALSNVCAMNRNEYIGCTPEASITYGLWN